MVKYSLEEEGFVVSSSGRVLAIRSGSDDPNGGSSIPIVELKQNIDPSNVVVKGSHRVSPWGTDNRFPNALCDLIYSNNLLPGLMEFKEDMAFGRGLTFVDLSGQLVTDSEFLKWIASWDVESWIESQLADYFTFYNVFGQYIKTRKGDKIARLEHVPAQECRCTVMENNQVNHILVADWMYKENDYKAYPVYDKYKELHRQGTVSMYHHYRPSSGYKYYGMPKYVGATKHWVPLANHIPVYHLSLIRNSLTALFHVEIPSETLEIMRARNNWTREDVDKWISSKVEEIDAMLTGSANAGKTLYTYTAKDPNSNTVFKWSITPIDNKAKQLSEGYLKLYNDSNQAITSAMQVQPSLACIQLGDKMSSGSEVLNAYNLHMQTRTQLPRKIVLKALSTAILINFPGKSIFPKFDNVLLVHQDSNKSGILHKEKEVDDVD